MYIDSHCHLSFPELKSQLPDLLAAMDAARVTQAVCICTTMEEFPEVRAIADAHRQLFATVGVHPDSDEVHEPSVDELVAGAAHPKVVAMDVAKAALDQGFHISFSGIVTFKNAADLREVAKIVPADRLLIETDSPYLAPVPYRGKLNQPAYVPHVAKLIAEVRGVSVETLAAQCTANTRRLFQLPEAA